MNLGQMTTEVALALGHMRSTHPWYAYIAGTSNLPGYISRAANKLVRMVVSASTGTTADLFPELHNSWTVGPTTAGSNIIPKPSDCIAVQRITRAESSTLPDWNLTQEKPLGEPMDAAKFGLLSKDSGSTGYAKIWARKGGGILIWPTPTSGYIDYLRFYGISSEPALVNPTDTLRMDEHWHDLVVTLTCYLVAMRMQRYEDAKALLAQVEQELQQTGNVTAWQDDIEQVEVEGMPTRLTVYGE